MIKIIFYTALLIPTFAFANTDQCIKLNANRTFIDASHQNTLIVNRTLKPAIGMFFHLGKPGFSGYIYGSCHNNTLSFNMPKQHVTFTGQLQYQPRRLSITNIHASQNNYPLALTTMYLEE